MMKIIKILSSFVICWVWVAPLAHSEEAEFNETFLHTFPGQTPINTEQFRYGNPIAKGDYFADVYVNNEFRGQSLLSFVEKQQEPIRGLCWSHKLLELLEIKAEAILQQPSSSQCISAVDATSQITFRFDVSTHRLDVSIPQALMILQPQGYIPRSRWQYGVPASFLKYQFNGYHYDTNHHKSSNHNQQFLGLQLGANLGSWSLRQQGSIFWNNGKQGNYQHIEALIQRDIDSINGRLKIGDFSTQSTLLENISLRGLSISSDSRMLPNSQTGYAPEVRGFAKSNARVRILQNNNIIYESTVTAGPFVISDLYAFSSTSGDLEVEVLESDGSKQVSIIPFSSTTNMLRPRQLRYDVSMGYYRSQNNTDNSPLLHTSLYYGLNNYLTLQAGTITNKDYSSNTLGGILGGKFGAISTDINIVHAKDNNSKESNTYSKLHIGYSKYFINSKTHLNTDFHHFFSKKNVDLHKALMPVYEKSELSIFKNNTLRNQYRISISQDLSKNMGGIYLSGIMNDYWDDKNYYNYQIGYNNSYKQMQYRLGLSKSYNTSKNKYDNAFYLNLSIPFYSNEKKRNLISTSATYNHSSQGEYSQISLNQTFGDLNQYNYIINLNKQKNHHVGLAGSINALLPMIKLGATVTKQDNNKQFSYTASGAIVAHQYGITLNNDLSDTFAIIHAKNASGTPILNGNGSKIDRWGNGIVSYLSPYQINHVSLDALKLPDNVDINATGREVIPRANTTNLVKFQTQTGKLVLFDIQLKNNYLPPLTTEARDEYDNIVGYTTQDGRLLTRLNISKGKIRLYWGDSKEDNKCEFNYELNVNDKKDLLIYPVKCL